MLHMKQLNSKKTRFPRFDKILFIQPIAEVDGEGNERQLRQEIVIKDLPIYQNATKCRCLVIACFRILTISKWSTARFEITKQTGPF